MEVQDKIIFILEELSGSRDIEPDDSLQDDLALDSMALVSLLIEIEDAFEIVLKEEDMNPFELNTVRDVIELVLRYGGD